MKPIVLSLGVVLAVVLAIVGVVLASPSSDTERVLVDTVIQVVPPDAAQLSMEIDAGELGVQVERVGVGAESPIEFSLLGYRGSDPAASVNIALPPTESSQSAIRQLAGGLYMVSLENQASVSQGDGLATRTNQAQRIHLKMVHSSTKLQSTSETAAPAPGPSSAENRAATIKRGLVESITRFHGSLRGDLADALDKHLLGVNNLYGRAITDRYFEALASIARDDALVGSYVLYMGPVLATRQDFPDCLFQDRFLDHFSREVARTGMAPTVPAFTDQEIKQMSSDERAFGALQGRPNEWPYGWSGRTLLRR